MTQHTNDWYCCPHCDKRVEELEREELTTSDAQGVAMVEHERNKVSRS